MRFCWLNRLAKLAVLGIFLAVFSPAATSYAEGGEKKEGEGDKGAPKVSGPTDRYVQHWVPMLGFSAAPVGSSEQEQVQPRPGRALVVVFLASWCEPCQQLMPEILRLEKHYNKLNTDFVYVFTHDTGDDAAGFMKEFALEHAYLANQDVLKIYHNPELPTIYVGDRHKWLAGRFVNVSQQDLAKLDNLLRPMTAY